MKHDKIIIKTYAQEQHELPVLHWTIIDDLCYLAAGLVLFFTGLYHYGGGSV